MNEVMLEAFGDELTKIAGLKDWWHGALHFFGIRQESPKVKSRVDYHFSPKAGPDKWRKFESRVSDPAFVKAISKHPDSDKKLVQHARAMHQLSRGSVAGKVQSSRLPGKSYEIRKIPGGLGCTCPDWRFKGTVAAGYDCKHIKAHKAGKKVA